MAGKTNGKRQNESLFSKALFKQSCKANGTMWTIIMAAVCFMLACVMLISGSGTLGEVKNSIQDTIITKEVDSQLEKRAINYYLNGKEGMEVFDASYAANMKDNASYLTWFAAMPTITDPSDSSQQAAYAAWQAQKPEMQTETGKTFASAVDTWFAAMPTITDPSDSSQQAALAAWKAQSPATATNAFTAAYSGACLAVQTYAGEKALEADPSYTEGTAEYLEILASTMFPINPPDTETDPTGATGMFDSFYAKETNEGDIPESFMSVLQAHASDLAYFSSEERAEYRAERAEDHAAIFLAVNMTEDENVENILAALASFGVTKEKYDSFNYKYDPLKALAFNTVVTYRGRITYETEVLDKSLARGEITAEEYKAQLTEKTAEVTGDITDSLLASLPQGVSDALEEIGQADLYTLIVGSIFYKLAGLLLPIIYMIMASNNLVAGQVDSGSMAYVLSTSTKRKTVVFTQAVYLIGSLFTMFCLTTITGCVCLAIVKTDVALTYGKLLLLNAGAFLVLFALSGLCFFTSCWFDRSKRSMAIGGGLSIFALVAAMLGLFGSPVIPSVVRMDSLNYFNKVTIISFFDVISIMDGTKVFLWKFAILAVLGILGYLAGSVRFTKKDLPL